LESFPYRVVTSSRRSGRRAPEPAPSRFFAPSTTSPGLAPECSGPSWSTAVPLSGFLNLSAVSWHTRAWRPCFMPPPPVGFSLQSVAPRWDRVRLSASHAPLQFSTTVPEVRCARPRPPGFHRRPRLATRWPGSHPRLDRRFRLSAPHAIALWSTRTARSRERPVDDFPDDLGLTHRSHLVPVASAASKLSSPRESVRAARRFRGHTAADALLGFAPPEP